MEKLLELCTSKLLNWEWEDIYGILMQYGKILKDRPDEGKQQLEQCIPVARAFCQALIEMGWIANTSEGITQQINQLKEEQINQIRLQLSNVTPEQFSQLSVEDKNKINQWRMEVGLPMMS